MRLYEYSREIRQLIDEMEENGYTEEGITKLNDLDISRNEKREATALYIKEQKAELKALKDVKSEIDEKIKSKENHIQNTMEYLASDLNGEKLKTSLVSCYYRKSTSVNVADDAVINLPDEFKNITVNPNKTEIGKALKSGAVIEGCSIIEKESLVIR